ncbi:hypothetical protein PGTUg99_023287 [Puccinia graminis f. sp. tritici]|uniref:Uncharacterized protein n=1 Tax=Puccinia graminis f. sp. tritici TaxID=56615 RepID=A0A5B0NWP2_PUCGR|nr:hypothetical protein PGTUg99_023287 [Puccinia graminis f. sp. tritici]
MGRLSEVPSRKISQIKVEYRVPKTKRSHKEERQRQRSLIPTYSQLHDRVPPANNDFMGLKCRDELFTGTNAEKSLQSKANCAEGSPPNSFKGATEISQSQAQNIPSLYKNAETSTLQHNTGDSSLQPKSRGFEIEPQSETFLHADLSLSDHQKSLKGSSGLRIDEKMIRSKLNLKARNTSDSSPTSLGEKVQKEERTVQNSLNVKDSSSASKEDKGNHSAAQTNPTMGCSELRDEGPTSSCLQQEEGKNGSKKGLDDGSVSSEPKSHVEKPGVETNQLKTTALKPQVEEKKGSHINNQEQVERDSLVLNPTARIPKAQMNKEINQSTSQEEHAENTKSDLKSKDKVAHTLQENHQVQSDKKTQISTDQEKLAISTKEKLIKSTNTMKDLGSENFFEEQLKLKDHMLAARKISAGLNAHQVDSRSSSSRFDMLTNSYRMIKEPLSSALNWWNQLNKHPEDAHGIHPSSIELWNYLFPEFETIIEEKHNVKSPKNNPEKTEGVIVEKKNKGSKNDESNKDRRFTRQEKGKYKVRFSIPESPNESQPLEGENQKEINDEVGSSKAVQNQHLDDEGQKKKEINDEVGSSKAVQKQASKPTDLGKKSTINQANILDNKPKIEPNKATNSQGLGRDYQDLVAQLSDYSTKNKGEGQ